MVRKGHRTERLATHQCCHGGTWYVMMEEDEMRRTLGRKNYMYRGVGRAELWGVGGSKQLKIPPGGGFGKGCKISYIFFGGGGGGGSGQPGNPSGYTLDVYYTTASGQILPLSSVSWPDQVKGRTFGVTCMFVECDLQRDTVTCRVPYGGLILFSNMNPHRR